MLFILLASCLIAISFGAGNIKVTNHNALQDYYFRWTFSNIDDSSCSIKGVYIYVNSQWKGYDQFYTEDGSPSYAWYYSTVGVKASDLTPISFKISTSTGDVYLWGIVTKIDTSSTFTSDQILCDGSPTAKPTPKPVTAPTAPTTPYPTSESICIDKDPDSLEWRSYDNQIYLNGNRFNMKGLSWFGFETGNYNLYGLDYHDQDWYFQWMVDNGFNAMRLPFSADFINGGSGNQALYKAAVQKAGDYGIFVMIDFHSWTAGAWTDGLDTINQAAAIGIWETMADLLKDEYNVFMADVFNEPHDVSNDEWGDWVQFCEDVGKAIWQKGVNWMIAMEGTNYDCSVLSCAWGENLEGIKNKGIDFDYTNYGENRFIYSPHVYGGDVTGSYSYSNAAWESHWGYLTKGGYEAAVVIGEFGTTYSGSMQNWLNSLVEYLVSIDQRNHFFWCLNPNSGDTGGLLQSDWTTEESGKLEALDKLQETPSKITVESSKICISNLGDPASLGASSFTATDDNGSSTVDTPTIVAVIVVGLLCIACSIVGGIYYHKRVKNNGQASFKQETMDTPSVADTPEPRKETVDNDSAEIEVEINMTSTQD